MKKYSTLFMIIICVCACAALCVFMALDVQIAADEITDTLANDCIIRAIACVAIVGIIFLCGYKGTFTNRRKNYGHALLWCIPCLLVVLANFPFSALISGTATVERYDILWLFILDCVLIALMEEMLFRGLLLNLVNELVKNKPLVAVIVESAIFALCHLLNLLSGASVGDTILQVGYTLLTGLMFSFVYVKTGNIWTGVVLHAIFDIGGKLIYYLGDGVFHDTIFWVLTVVCAVLCGLHILFTLLVSYKRKKNFFEDK